MEETEELKTRRQEAQTAMEAPEQREKRLEKLAVDERRRADAYRAMAAQEQKARRSAREKTRREKEEAEAARFAAAEAAAKAAQTSKAESIEKEWKIQQDRAAMYAQRLEGIHSSERQITEIKSREEVSLPPLRTLKTDMELAARQEALSAAKLALAEQAKRRQQAAAAPAPAPRGPGRLWGLALLVLILAAAGTGGWAWYTGRLTLPWINDLSGLFTSAPEPLIWSETQAAIEVTSPIGTAINLSPREILDLIVTETNAPGDWNFKQLYLTRENQPLPWAQASASLGLTLPEALSRSLNPDYQIGAYQLAGERGRFLVLQSNLPNQTYAALLNWEPALAPTLLPLLYDTPPALPLQNFSDRLVRNQDARVLATAEGGDILFYAFLDGNTLVFAPNEQVFREILKVVTGSR